MLIEYCEHLLHLLEAGEVGDADIRLSCVNVQFFSFSNFSILYFTKNASVKNWDVYMKKVYNQLYL